MNDNSWLKQCVFAEIFGPYLVVLQSYFPSRIVREMSRHLPHKTNMLYLCELNFAFMEVKINQ